MRKQHQRIDVNILREILKKKFCTEKEKGYSKKVLLKIIQEINKVEIKLKGLKQNYKNEIESLNFKEYGFRNANDIKIDVREDVFENKTIITLKPKAEYELEGILQLTAPSSYKHRNFIALMCDTYERIKIKADNIIDEVDNKDHIELYATKNIQKAVQIFFEAKAVLDKIHKRKDDSDKFFVYIQMLFIANIILYLQNIFASFYKEKQYSKRTLQSEIFDSINLDIAMEPTTEYGKKQVEEKPKRKKLIWKKNINILITLHYDLYNDNSYDAQTKDIENFIHDNYLNKQGKEISRETIRICMQKFRDDKRAKGKKRIDISNYKDTKEI